MTSDNYGDRAGQKRATLQDGLDLNKPESKDPNRAMADLYESGRQYPNGRPKVSNAHDRVTDDPAINACQRSQFASDEQAARYDNIASGWIRGQTKGGGCDNPNFDKSTARKGNDKPISKGGSNTSKSPFSAAGRNVR